MIDLKKIYIKESTKIKMLKEYLIFIAKEVLN